MEPRCLAVTHYVDFLAEILETQGWQTKWEWERSSKSLIQL